MNGCNAAIAFIRFAVTNVGFDPQPGRVASSHLANLLDQCFELSRLVMPARVIQLEAS